MSDASVAAALRTEAGVVVVEAPAGCGKTYQAASYAADRAAALRPGRMLVLTHTHAASDVIARRVANTADATIRTIDSLLIEIASAYHRAIDLPADVSGWARQNEAGFEIIGARVAAILGHNPAIAAGLAKRYRVILCDEHQDSSPHQHAVVMAVRQAGSLLRVFGDPMQTIYGDKEEFQTAGAQWAGLIETADAVERLEFGHRWQKTAPELGEWIQAARTTLQQGGRIDLRVKLPKGLTIFRAENRGYGYGDYRLDPKERPSIDAFVDGDDPLLVLAAQNKTVGCLRAVFNRRLPIWEGHTRGALDVLVQDATKNTGNPAELARALTGFVSKVTVGFTVSEFANPFIAEVETGCAKTRRGKPAVIQDLARSLLAQPNHKGIGTVLRKIEEHAARTAGFDGIKIDHLKEYREATQLAEFGDMNKGHAEITRRRGFLRPAPAKKCLSTVHKAKGLECDRVLVVPCDANHFGDKAHHRCLLYVALSRPVRELALVIPHDKSSPLFAP